MLVLQSSLALLSSRIDLLTFAAHLVVPIHECAVGVVPPSPDVQFEMCRQPVSVRATDELERLPLEHRRTVVMREPGVGYYNELHANQLQTASRRFVYQYFRPRGIQLAVADQSAINVVIAHCSVIRAADAAQERLVTGSCGSVNVDVRRRSVANELNELGRGGLRVTGMPLPGLFRCSTVRRDKHCGRGNTAQHRQTQDAHVEFVDKSFYLCRHSFVL